MFTIGKRQVYNIQFQLYPGDLHSNSLIRHYVIYNMNLPLLWYTAGMKPTTPNEKTYLSTVQQRVSAHFTRQYGTTRETKQFSTTIPARLADKAELQKGEVFEWLYIDTETFLVTRITAHKEQRRAAAYMGRLNRKEQQRQMVKAQRR